MPWGNVRFFQNHRLFSCCKCVPKILNHLQYIRAYLLHIYIYTEPWTNNPSCYAIAWYSVYGNGPRHIGQVLYRRTLWKNRRWPKKATVKDPPWNTALPLKFDDWNRWQFRNQNGPEFQGTWLFTFFFWGGNVKIWYSFFKRRSFVKKDMGASVCHLGSFGWACLKIPQRPPKNRAWDRHPGVFSIQSSDCVSICINQWRKTKTDIGGVGQAMLALRYLLTFWAASIFGYHLTIEPQKLKRIPFHTNTMIIIRNYKWYPNGANIREPKFGIFRRNGIWEMYRNVLSVRLPQRMPSMRQKKPSK